MPYIFIVLNTKKILLNKKWLLYCLYLDNKVRIIMPFEAENRAAKVKECCLKCDIEGLLLNKVYMHFTNNM